MQRENFDNITIDNSGETKEQNTGSPEHNDLEQKARDILAYSFRDYEIDYMLRNLRPGALRALPAVRRSTNPERRRDYLNEWFEKWKNETEEGEKFEMKECRFGKGLFSKRDIKKGESILKFEGSKINVKNTLGKPENEVSYPLQFRAAYYVNPSARANYINIAAPGAMANHSCDPNAGIREDLFLVAIKDITKGEEILWDYSTSMDEDHWEMDCACGSPDCRHKIRDFYHLPQEIKEKYLKMGIVMNHIAAQYLRQYNNKEAITFESREAA